MLWLHSAVPPLSVVGAGEYTYTNASHSFDCDDGHRPGEGSVLGGTRSAESGHLCTPSPPPPILFVVLLPVALGCVTSDVLH